MTLDEAIKNCKKKSEYYRELIITECEDGREFYNPDAERYAEEHEQLAEWLKDYKRLLEERQTGEWIDYSNSGYVECPICECLTNCEGNIDELHYCWNCGAKLRKGDAENE